MLVVPYDGFKGLTDKKKIVRSLVSLVNRDELTELDFALFNVTVILKSISVPKILFRVQRITVNMESVLICQNISYIFKNGFALCFPFDGC